ncbi:MAG: helix-turn-helix transcriptional regulator [Prevotella sp.]|nr:helix-turn-helix transcriptional regulator [Prevotella sp.]
MSIPRIAVIEPNAFAVMGLRGILQNVMPMLVVDAFSNVGELREQGGDYVHYFVGATEFINDMAFFHDKKKRTIILVVNESMESRFPGIHTLCVCKPEKQLVRDVLSLMQSGHGHNVNGDVKGNGLMPPVMSDLPTENKLSDREIEVLALVAQGYINKEIADRLCISITTVISHRKNITEKLGIKTVSGLTIYAAMHGYIRV